jgi:methionyl-tRNA synthetase
MNGFAFYKALQDVFEITGLLNRYIDSEAPWKLAKEDEKRLKTVLFNIWNGVRIATILLYPFMPEKTAIIWNALGKRDAIESATFQNEKVFYHSEELAVIEKIPPIFPRVEA